MCTCSEGLSDILRNEKEEKRKLRMLTYRNRASGWVIGCISQTGAESGLTRW